MISYTKVGSRPGGDMRSVLAALAFAIGGGLAAVALPGAPAEAPQSVELAPGDAAPPFALKGSDGRTYRLADYRGKQVVVLAWFAKAFTGG